MSDDPPMSRRAGAPQRSAASGRSGGPGPSGSGPSRSGRPGASTSGPEAPAADPRAADPPGAGRAGDVDAEVARLARRHRRRTAAIVGVVASSVGLVAVATASSMSPGEHEAQRRPPAAEPVTAQPQVQELRDVRSGQCTLSADARDVVSAGAPAGADVAVFTRVDIAAGSAVTAGQRLVEVSGRPVLALPLPFALYRDIPPGATGTDVEAVQDALSALGLLGQHRHGTFDYKTRQAVAALYEQAGVEPARTGPEVDMAVDTAQAQVDAINQRIAAGDPAAGGELAAAQSALDEARSHQGVILPRAEVAAVPADATVVSVAAAVGGSAEAGQVIAAVGTAGVQASCQFAAGAGNGVAEGHEAVLRDVTGTAHPGTMGPVGVAEGVTQSAFLPAAPLPADKAGTTAQVEVVVARTGGEVLTVPAKALHAQGDGTLAVETIAGGRRTRVPVTTGLTAGGWVEIVDPPFPADATLVLGGRATATATDTHDTAETAETADGAG